MLGPLPPLLVVGGHPLRAWYVVGEAAFNLINPREDVARRLKLRARCAWVVLGWMMMSLEGSFHEFNALGDAAVDMIQPGNEVVGAHHGSQNLSHPVLRTKPNA